MGRRIVPAAPPQRGATAVGEGERSSGEIKRTRNGRFQRIPGCGPKADDGSEVIQ